MRRILRIWPLYFLILIFNFGVVLPLLNRGANGSYFNYHVWKHLAFISNYHVINIIKHNLPSLLIINITWSISIEEHFYLIWPLIFIFFSRNEYRFYIVVIILSIFLYFGLKLEPSKFFYFTTPSGMIFLAFGGLIAMLNFINSRLSIPKTVSVLFYVLSIAYLARYIPAAPNIYIDIIIKCIIMGFIITGQALNRNRIFNLGKIPLLNEIGKISYGIYLLHPICFLVVDCILSITIGYGTIRNICIIVIGIPFIYLVCTASYHYERYFLKFKTKFS